MISNYTLLKLLNFLVLILMQSVLLSQVNEQYIDADLIKKNNVNSHREIYISASRIDTSASFYYFEHGGKSYHKYGSIVMSKENGEFKSVEGSELTEHIYNDKEQLVEILKSSGREHSDDRWYTGKKTFQYNDNGLLEKCEIYQPADDNSPQIRYYHYTDSLISSEIIYWQTYNDSSRNTEIYRTDSTVYVYDDSKTEVVGVEFMNNELVKKWTMDLVSSSDTCYYETYNYSDNKVVQGYRVYDDLGRVIISYMKAENTEETYYYSFYENGLPKEWGEKREDGADYRTCYIYEYRKN